MPAVLSPAWLATLRDASGVVELSRDAACRLVFATDAVAHLVIEGGRVVALGEGPIDAPDAVLGWSPADAQAIFTRQLRGDDALRATTVEARRADGSTYAGPPAPLNLSAQPELKDLPRIPDATFVVQYHYREGPFGLVSYVLAFEDGRVVDERLGDADAPAVTVDVTYRAMALVRCGEMTILEALETGRVDGQLGAMAALAGISESREFHAAEVATGRHAVALAALGELDAHPVYAEAVAALSGSPA